MLAPDASLPYAESMTKRLLIIDGALDRSVYRPVGQWATYLDDTPFDAIHLPSRESALSPPTHAAFGVGSCNTTHEAAGFQKHCSHWRLDPISWRL